jgi:aspartate/methionine/tyrosine aminotransferase
MILPPHLVDPINSLQQNMFINAPTISQTAALQCWDKAAQAELQGHVAKYRASRTLILEALATLPGLDMATQVAPADGGFYVYVDLGESLTAPGLGSVAFCQSFLEEQYVAVTPGVDFEDPSTPLGDRRVRISYAGGLATVTRAMERLHVFWALWIERVLAAKAVIPSPS